MKKMYFLLLFLYAADTAAQEDEPEKPKKRVTRLLPDHVNAQFAGSIGFVSAGPGYSFSKDKLRLDLMYGYVPASQGGDYINTLNLKLSGDLFRMRIGAGRELRPYAALLVSVETSGNSIINLPERYPDGYYMPSGIHLLGYLGMRLKTPLGKKGQYLSCYAETGTVDSYVYYYLRNTGTLRFTDLFSASLGVVYHLR